MILVVGLGFGRQVLQWWSAGRPEIKGPQRQAAPAAGLEDPSQPHELRFGEKHWAISERSAAGSRQDAVRMLRDHCRKTIQSADFPNNPPGPAEREFLRWIADRQPAEEEPGGWRLYTLDDPYPMVVGTRPDRTSPEPVASHARRVVTWGLAVPKGQQGWTLYSFHPASPSSDLGGEFPDIPLPPGFRRIFSMGAGESGGTVMVFRGPFEMERCKEFYSSWCKTHGWAPADGWQPRGSAWLLHCLAKARDAGRRLDLQLTPDDRGGMSGLVLVHAASPVTSESERR
jgi:hypothetical protein